MKRKPLLFLLITGGIFLFILFLVGLTQFWEGKRERNNLGVESLTTLGTLSAEETLFDFGEISMAKGVVKHTFRIKNSTEGPVIIPKIYTSCMCTIANYIKGEIRKGPFGMRGHGISRPLYEKLEKGEEAEVEVTFDPAAHGPAGVGPVEREIVLEQQGGEPFKLRIKAVVTP